MLFLPRFLRHGSRRFQRSGLPFVFWYCYQLHAGKADISFRRRKAREAYLIGREKGLIDDYGDPVNPTASARAQAAAASVQASDASKASR